MSITSDIGIMQGRLSPRVDGKIQAFPLNNWENEFKTAKEIGFTSIEWIVENPLDLNPLLSEAGVKKIKELIFNTNVKIDFICADVFMQEPIKEDKESINDSRILLSKLIKESKKINAKYIEIPFVDNSSIKNKKYNYLIDFFNSFEKELEIAEMFINLETDLNPIAFRDLLNNLNPRVGANYDIGNSASLGYEYY